MKTKKETLSTMTDEEVIVNALKIIEKRTKSTPESVVTKEDEKLEQGKPHEPKTIKDQFIKNIFPRSTQYLINMELRNGDHRSFIISSRDNTFKFKGGNYILDSQLKHYNIDAKMYALDYHQDFTLPIKRHINPELLREEMITNPEIEVEYSTTPSTLHNFLVSKIAEGVMQGQQLSKVMSLIRTLLIIITITTILHFLLFVQASGLLKGVNLPF